MFTSQQLLSESLVHFHSEQVCLTPEALVVSVIIVDQAWKSQTSDLQQDHKQLVKDIAAREEKLDYLRELLISKQIEPEDYREMKTGNSEKLERLKAKLGGLKQDTPDVKTLLKQDIDKLMKLDCMYEATEPELKRAFISSMFPEKMHFEKSSGRVNEAVWFIYRIDSALCENKNRTTENKSGLSYDAALPVQISNLFLEDLKKLVSFSNQLSRD